MARRISPSIRTISQMTPEPPRAKKITAQKRGSEKETRARVPSPDLSVELKFQKTNLQPVLLLAYHEEGKWKWIRDPKTRARPRMIPPPPNYRPTVRVLRRGKMGRHDFIIRINRDESGAPFPSLPSSEVISERMFLSKYTRSEFLRSLERNPRLTDRDRERILDAMASAGWFNVFIPEEPISPIDVYPGRHSKRPPKTKLPREGIQIQVLQPSPMGGASMAPTPPLDTIDIETQIPAMARLCGFHLSSVQS